MAIAKGQHQPDHSYKYTCGKCQGRGKLPNGICDHCYSLNMELLLEQFQTARGERYYAILKAILSVKGKAIHDRAVQIKQETGKVSPLDLGIMCIEFGFGTRMKPLVEWLEECRLAPTGLYTNLQERGMKVGKVLEAAQKHLDEQKAG